MQRQERIRDLAEKEYARRKLPLLLTAIGTALSSTFSESNALSWEISKKLRSAITEHMRSSIHTKFSPAGRAEFDQEFQQRVQAFGYENVVLSLGGFESVPLVQVQASMVASKFYELWKIGDTVLICSADLSRGVMADWYPDDAVHAFEIASWGAST